MARAECMAGQGDGKRLDPFIAVSWQRPGVLLGLWAGDRARAQQETVAKAGRVAGHIVSLVPVYA